MQIIQNTSVCLFNLKLTTSRPNSVPGIVILVEHVVPHASGVRVMILRHFQLCADVEQTGVVQVHHVPGCRVFVSWVSVRIENE